MNRQKLIDSYATAFKLGYHIKMTHDGPPSIHYDEKQRIYHPIWPKFCKLLETVLLGAEECTGDWLSDAARELQTTTEYLEGFIKGLEFKITPDDEPS